MKKLIIALGVGVALFGWSCSKVETSHGLKQTVERNVSNINYAISRISETPGYKLLTTSGESAKSEAFLNDSITLSQIAGIYDFQHDTVFHMHHSFPYRLFKKTGTSDMLIVNLPEKLVLHPRYLHFYEPKDSIPPNNFTITATGYHFYYTMFQSFDYSLTAGLTLNTEDVGSMDIAASSASFNAQMYSSKFTFKDGYNISAQWESGDTTKSSFALAKDNDILLKEAVTFIWHNNHKSEKSYTISIGNIDVKRVSGVDSIQVFQDGVLQKEAAAFITDNPDSTGTICNKRDILLTFDDGTTAKLSELINPALTQLRTMINSLHEMYFAKNIVDYIALSIYWDSH